jgi:gamma-glutamyl hydrolase
MRAVTGGETPIKTLSSPYMQAASRLYNASISRHHAGERFPLWGTCMGMQVLSILGARDPSVLLSHAFDSEGLMLPLQLTDEAAGSMLLCEACLHPPDALKTLTQHNSTVNLHHDGVDPSSFARASRLGEAFKVLSTNVDARGKPFVSTIEARDGAPVWGTQWHPERPQFEWKHPSEDVFDHSAEVIQAMFAVASRFVQEVRLSPRRFGSTQQEDASLIYNFDPVGTTSYQAYFF